MQDDWVLLYTSEPFGKAVEKFQRKYINGEEDLKTYRGKLPGVIQPLQKPIYEKWNFGTGRIATMNMQMAFLPHDDNPQIQANAATLNALLGLDMEWVPRSLQSH